MINHLKWSLTGGAVVLGVIGDPIAHSLSPAMQNAALQAVVSDCVYVPFHVCPEGLHDALRGMLALGIRGLNVTIPHKVAVLPYLDDINPVARLIGAVNTIHNFEGRLIGYNTDGIGFVRSLQAEGQRTPKGQRITILGAGGAARAIGFQLALLGARTLVIANRTQAKAIALATEIEAATGCRAQAVDFHHLATHLPRTDILINTTCLGMYPHVTSSPPVEMGLLPSHVLVCDIVYNPMETQFLRAAKTHAFSILPGLGMLAYQGAAALEIWLGCRAPIDEMKVALVKQLEGFGSAVLP